MRWLGIVLCAVGLQAQRAPRVVDTVPAMLALPASTAQPDALVVGVGGGHFKWIAASTATTNTADVFARTYGAATGRWVRQQIDDAVLPGGATLLNALLRGWANSTAFTLTSATRDSDGVITTATVSWPDGSAGTFTTVTKNATFLTIDAYTVTHTSSGRTVTQASVTRNASGYVTAQPALSITP